MNLHTLTLTGADDNTDIDELFEIGCANPYVEWGILYSETQAGNGRYCSKAMIDRLVNKIISNTDCKFALHVCGRAVNELLTGTGQVSEIANHFGRIQVNFRSGNFELMDIKYMISSRPSQVIITQFTQHNSELWKQLISHNNHSILFDASGGRGIECTKWLPPLPDVNCGYAGGLGPDNIIDQLIKINNVVGNNSFWVDMEGKLRDSNDNFDIDAALQVIDNVNYLTANALK